MAKITPHYHFVMPDPTDACDVTVLNANYQLLDNALCAGEVTQLAVDITAGADTSISLSDNASDYSLLAVVVDTACLFGLVQGNSCWLGGMRSGGTALKLVGAQLSLNGRSLTVKAINEMELRTSGITAVGNPQITAVYGIK